MRIAVLTILLFMIVTLSAFAGDESPFLAGNDLPEVVKICGDDGEWPPYAFWERVNGRKGDAVVGYTVDLLNEIFSIQGDSVITSHTFELLPWKRCLQNVQRGDKHHIAADASFNEERGRTFLFSDPIYHTHRVLTYPTSLLPDGPQVDVRDDIKKYKVCGVLGYNYQLDGLDDHQVDATATSLAQVVEKLKRNRCQVNPEMLEIMLGLEALGMDVYQDGKLEWIAAPYAAPLPFHLIFPRTPQGEALQDFVNHRIKTLQESGAIEKLRQKWLE